MAKFEPGHHFSKGRPLGSPNKKRSIYALCEEKGVDPFAVLIELMQDEDKGLKLAAARELCQYLEPKLKGVEHSGEIANPHMNRTLEDLEAEVKAKLK